MSASDAMLRTLLVQKKSREDECVGLLQKAQAALTVLSSQRRQAEDELNQLREQHTPLAPGRRRLQELQRDEAHKKLTEDSALLMARLCKEEAQKQQDVEHTQAQFTRAAQERRAIESALEDLKKRQDKVSQQKQEEERDEAWRLLRSLRGVK